MTATLREIPALVEARKPFKGNSMSAYAYEPFRSGFSIDTGRMPADDERTAFRESLITYVVLSYNTPIGYLTHEGKWVRLSHRYSVTTSKHQGKIPLSD